MAKRNRTGTGRSAVVGRFFRGLPVVDATEPLRVVVNKRDISCAKKLDPNQCVYAQACKRLFDSHAVLFLRRTAYIELPDSRGRRVVNRFMISREVHQKIVKFDKTGKADEGGFILNPPSFSKTLGWHAEYAKRYRRDIQSGKRTITHTKPNQRSIKAMLGVRDGRGKLGINYAF